ncbi:uncharacterized protein LOC107363027 [Tetranychus urticae]|uniref:Lipid-binding serum glycoprotein N-terminal domain-containing protein n=1 Tax=Tetranychus urticae TaxID=32264 RepID=T1JPP2_TETUR|nr:uncharacterized protein LOC107363027 [Tetranychus urticae]
MIKTFSLSVLFLGLICSSLASHVPEDDEQDPNEFVDSILTIAVKKIHEQGAISIPGKHKVGPFGLLTIQDVAILGIQNISRRGEAHIRGVEESGIIYVNTSFTLTNIRANSSFVVNLPMKGAMRVTATSTIARIDLTVRAQYNPAKGTLTPEAVHIDSFSGVVTVVKGLGPFNPIVEKMTTITADVLERIIAKILNITIEHTIDGLVITIPQEY